jgi:hypothetical protein
MGVQTNNVKEKLENSSNVIEWDKQIHGINTLAGLGAKGKYVYDNVKDCVDTYLDVIQYEDIVTIYSEWYITFCLNGDYSGGGDIFIITTRGIHHSTISFSIGGATHFRCSFYKMYIFNNKLSHQLSKLFINYASMQLPMIFSPCHQQCGISKEQAYNIHTNKFMAMITSIPGVKLSPLMSGWEQVGPNLYYHIQTKKKSTTPPYQSPPVSYS